MGTDAKLDLLIFLNSTPAFSETLEELASRIGRSPSEAELAMRDFVDLSAVLEGIDRQVIRVRY
jgi:hypothetical protein